MGWLKFALGVLALLFTPFAGTAQPGNPEGRWALHAGGRTIMILELAHDADGGWSGSLTRQRFQLSGSRAPGSQVFSEVKGPPIETAIRNFTKRSNHYEFSVDDPLVGTPDAYTFRVAQDGSGELAVGDVPLAPFIFVRASLSEQLSENWDVTRSYAVDWNRPSNPEMTAIFEADQEARRDPGYDWKKVARDDTERRARTKALLDAGTLQSGDDFYHAAFVFQHGGKPEDYLMAHTLATIAIARGRRSATWIAAATLDRYLQNIGQSQIYGTQYNSVPNGGLTQEPYEEMLVSDAVRGAMGVPPLNEQEQTRKELEAKQQR